MSVNDPDPYDQAVQALANAEDSEEEDRLVRAQARALIGIGWALLAIARKR